MLKVNDYASLSVQVNFESDKWTGNGKPFETSNLSLFHDFIIN